MQQHELDSLFDQQAAGYDAQWARMAPIRESLHFLLEPVFADLPDDARLLCVGAGTGAEIAHLARRFARWQFLALDPSAQMIEVCRARAVRDGFADRCAFHVGLLDSLPQADTFDGAAFSFAGLSSAPAASISMNGAPTSIVSPSFTSTFVILPACGAGIGIVAFSVSTSSRSWSALTVSPSLTKIVSTSPDSIFSPRLGSLICVGISIED